MTKNGEDMLNPFDMQKRKGMTQVQRCVTTLATPLSSLIKIRGRIGGFASLPYNRFAQMELADSGCDPQALEKF
jgi:hypothetical protein